MARPRRRSEAPKLRVIPGGKQDSPSARAVVQRTSKAPQEPDLRGRPSLRANVAPANDERIAEEDAATTDVEPAVSSPRAEPAISARRRLVALVAAFAAALLAFLLLRRRG